MCIRDSFGPVADTSDGLIKKVQVDYYSTVDRENARRQLRYTATPKALKDYNNDNTAVLDEPITKSKTKISVNDSTNFAVGDRIIIGTEIMKIKSIPDNGSLTVTRGWDKTTAASHLENTSIDILSNADDILVEPDDDFGFNGTITDYTDSGSYSPTRQTDI